MVVPEPSPLPAGSSPRPTNRCAACSLPGCVSLHYRCCKCACLPVVCAACWSGPFLIHVAVATVGVVLLLFVAFTAVVTEMDLNPLSRNPLAVASSRWVGPRWMY